jgi:FkbM family methyltransferase
MRILKFSSAIVLGLILAAFFQALINERPWVLAMAAKAVGRNVSCPWPKLISMPWSALRFVALQEQSRKELSLLQTDERLAIELIRAPTRSFWIKKAGIEMDGRMLLGYVLAEQEWIAESARSFGVRPGDVVVDVGAHVGTFGDDALRLGAAKVIMVEPVPVNVECIRRNFKQEIAAGKVIVVPEGAWSKADTLRFSVGVANSGTGSFVIPEPGHSQIEVPVRPLDDMLQSIGIAEVHFIKMDIEGAEREALKGAARTLAHYKPRLMLDLYHRSDDELILPQVIAAANPNYRMACAVCSPSREEGNRRIIPYATFFY